MRTEREKMVAGEAYDPMDLELAAARRRARDLCRDLNAAPEGDATLRRHILAQLFGRGGDTVWMQPPFFCDYGTNIRLGSRVYMNFDCVILDCGRVTIGDNVLFGPGVHIYAATHPIDPELRKSGRELALPVTIGDNVWIGGGVKICPGVTIGSSTAIGAGSVVVHDVPAGVVAAGNPCRVVREA